LYLNKGNWKFDDISTKAGFKEKKQWSTGVVMADINADGWLDIFVCNAGSMDDPSLRRNQLFINNHDLTFTDSAAAFGLDDMGYTTQVSFLDYDLDGDLDCFMINNSPISPVILNYENKRNIRDKDWKIAPNMKGGGDYLFRNDNGKFIDVSEQAGIYGSTMSFGLGVTVGDVNNDGYPDVYVSNDFYEQDYLYMNQKDGTFKDEMEQCMQHTSLASMGADVGDINNDGYPDIFTTDMLPGDDYRLKTTFAFETINDYRLKQHNGIYHQFFQNTLQVNNKNGKFADIANYAGVAATDWSWGGLMFDADNDGNNDLFVCNGIFRDLINQDFLDFKASEVMNKMKATGKKEDMSVLIDAMPSIHVPNKMYRNNGDLGISLMGSGKNTFAIGSTIKIYATNQVFTREVIPSRGFQSSIDYKMIIGLGGKTKVDSMIIRWPDRSYSKYVEPLLNKVYVVKETVEKKYPYRSFENIETNKFFSPMISSFDKHVEDDHVDFFYERNTPKMLSREGPRSAVADINHDGLEDIFIGGTVGHPGQLYLQKAEGVFIKKEEKAFLQFSDFEDNAVLFFDADKDNDADLLICPGGNTSPGDGRHLQLRLFKNDSKGNFTIDTKAFPFNGVDISVVVSNDFDSDGDNDLFVGGRSIPQQYGLSPASYLFVNDGQGHFSDIAKTKNPDIANIGMVTGAAWADIAGDKQKELIIVGDWMAPRIFTFDKSHFTEVKTNLSGMYGWWQTITVSDINNDGKQDLLLGNVGNNGYLRPDSSNLVKLFLNDFDNNGTIDNILTYTVDGKDKPVFLKHDLEGTIPSLKKNNLKHAEYATKTMTDLFTSEVLNRSIVKKFNYSYSCIAINNGNGNFSVQKFPTGIQLSSVNVIRCVDINGDNIEDVLTGGNLFDFQPQLERYDASLGEILINDGKGNLVQVDQSKTGLQLRGQLRDIGVIRNKDKKYLLFLQNDQIPLLYKMKGDSKQ